MLDKQLENIVMNIYLACVVEILSKYGQPCPTLASIWKILFSLRGTAFTNKRLKGLYSMSLSRNLSFCISLLDDSLAIFSNLGCPKTLPPHCTPWLGPKGCPHQNNFQYGLLKLLTQAYKILSESSAPPYCLDLIQINKSPIEIISKTEKVGICLIEI